MTSRAVHCPKCGFLVALVPSGSSSHMEQNVLRVAPLLTSQQSAVFGLLVRRFGIAISSDAILFAMYPGGGEPENIDAAIKVCISKLRRAIRVAGVPWTIPHGSDRTYRLMEQSE